MGIIAVHLKVERENHHGDRKNPCWHHWSEYAGSEDGIGAAGDRGSV